MQGSPQDLAWTNPLGRIPLDEPVFIIFHYMQDLSFGFVLPRFSLSLYMCLSFREGLPGILLSSISGVRTVTWDPIKLSLFPSRSFDFWSLVSILPRLNSCRLCTYGLLVHSGINLCRHIISPLYIASQAPVVLALLSR